jgi:hypothetical protein
MGWLRFIRDLPVGCKLALTVVGPLVLLSGTFWFALDRPGFVTSIHAGVTTQAAVPQAEIAKLLRAEQQAA